MPNSSGDKTISVRVDKKLPHLHEKGRYVTTRPYKTRIRFKQNPLTSLPRDTMRLLFFSNINFAYFHTYVTLYLSYTLIRRGQSVSIIMIQSAVTNPYTPTLITYLPQHSFILRRIIICASYYFYPPVTTHVYFIVIVIKSTLNVYYQNVRGLRTKSHQCYNNILSNSYDIIVMVESWLYDGIFDREFCDDRCEVLSVQSQPFREFSRLFPLS